MFGIETGQFIVAEANEYDISLAKLYINPSVIGSRRTLPLSGLLVAQKSLWNNNCDVVGIVVLARAKFIV